MWYWDGSRTTWVSGIWNLSWKLKRLAWNLESDMRGMWAEAHYWEREARKRGESGIWNLLRERSFSMCLLESGIWNLLGFRPINPISIRFSSDSSDSVRFVGSNIHNWFQYASYLSWCFTSWDGQFGTWNLESGIWNLKFEIWNLKCNGSFESWDGQCVQLHGTLPRSAVKARTLREIT